MCAHALMDETSQALVWDAAEVAAAHTVVLMIPGALARIEMFDAARAWARSGVALVFMRFPGLDGRPLSPKLGIETSAAQIAEFAAAHPGKIFRILGYSTGGPIAIRAAEQISEDVRVAALSSAVDRAGGLRSFSRITLDLLEAAWRAWSLRRRVVWLEYFKLLLYGTPVVHDKDLAERAEALLKAHLPRMVYPDPDLLAAHSDDLRQWRLPEGKRLEPSRLAFFAGEADPVFSLRQTYDFARRFRVQEVTRYPGHGHLTFMTHPRVFEDIRDFFDL